jgi:O-acetyl-ADP-ribose deacetylase (regulator of RNase III)
LRAAAAIAVHTVRAYTVADETIREVTFACFGDDALAVYLAELSQRSPSRARP